MLFVLVSCVVSTLACYLIVRSGGWHLAYTGDHPGRQPQKFHTQPVPRIGGVGVLLGMLAGGFMLSLPVPEFERYWLLQLSLLPAFFGGFAEDITHRIGPGTRLLLTVITAAFAYSLVGVHFERSHMAWLDRALAYAPFAYLALLVAVAGVAHAMNIIDGYNGLAAGVSLIILAALGYVAHQSGDALVASFCWGSAAATLGFLWFNYPTGRIFLGDGGAYLLGCTIALAAALLVLRNPHVSPWFPMALVIYPVWETVFSTIRRVTLDRRVSAPDARHLHSLVYRRLSRRWVRGRRQADRVWRNALTTLPFWAVNVVLTVASVAWYDSTRVQQLLIVLFVICYCLAYWRIPQPRPGRRKRASGGVSELGTRPGQG